MSHTTESIEVLEPYQPDRDIPAEYELNMIHTQKLGDVCQIHLRTVKKEAPKEHEGTDDNRRDGQADIQAWGGTGQEIALTHRVKNRVKYSTLFCSLNINGDT